MIDPTKGINDLDEMILVSDMEDGGYYAWIEMDGTDLIEVDTIPPSGWRVHVNFQSEGADLWSVQGRIEVTQGSIYDGHGNPMEFVKNGTIGQLYSNGTAIFFLPFAEKF